MSREPNNSEVMNETHAGNGDLQAECDRLREALRRAETERDEYRCALLGVLRSQVKEEDIVIPDEKDCLPFEAFAHELDAIVDKA